MKGGGEGSLSFVSLDRGMRREKEEEEGILE